MKRTQVWRLALGVLLGSVLSAGAATPGHAATLAYEALGGNFIGAPVSIGETNRVDTFIVGTNHHLYHKILTPAGWQPASGFEDLGGYVLGKPAVIHDGPNRLDVFVVGGDHALYHKYYDGAAWQPSQTGYEDLGGIVVGNPAAVTTGAGRFDVFVVGTDDAVYRKSFDGTAWFPSKQSYEDLSGITISDPTVVSSAPGRIDLFIVGTDNALYHKYSNGGETWLPSETGYENLGGIIVGQPTVATNWSVYQRLDVFIVGTDEALYHKYYNPYAGAWAPSPHGFENLGGHLSGNPQVVFANNLYVLAEGTDHAVYDKYWDGTSWHPGTTSFENLGGQTVGDLSAVSDYFGGRHGGAGGYRVDLFVIGTDHGLYHKFEVGGTWYSLS